MGSEERDSDKPFKVQDRRRFSATGEARAESEAAPAEPAPAAAPEPPPAAPAAEAPSHHEHAHAELSFATFVISLSTQALALLGEIPDPVQGRTAVDLEGARQFIDILGILQDKTRGNLDAREAALLEGALYDLRMKYVERANR
ncbi:DUF1844 domain-containing protein [bacterium]|nr:DUF1844 domain-containing protein [bacterium]